MDLISSCHIFSLVSLLSIECFTFHLYFYVDYIPGSLFSKVYALNKDVKFKNKENKGFGYIILEIVQNGCVNCRSYQRIWYFIVYCEYLGCSSEVSCRLFDPRTPFSYLHTLASLETDFVEKFLVIICIHTIRYHCFNRSHLLWEKSTHMTFFLNIMYWL